MVDELATGCLTQDCLVALGVVGQTASVGYTVEDHFGLAEAAMET